MAAYKKAFAVFFILCSLYSSMRFASAVFDAEHYAPSPVQTQLRGAQDSVSGNETHLSKYRKAVRRPIYSKQNFLEERTTIRHEEHIAFFLVETLSKSKAHRLTFPTHLRAPPSPVL